MADDANGRLTIIDDYIPVIKNRFGPQLSGSYLASALVDDLILTDVLPVDVDHIDDWWIVSAATDWLIQSEGSVSLWNFTHIVHFPQKGREACRSEILLTAYAEAVITAGRTSELAWIVGNPDRSTLPARILERLSKQTVGRLVAFQMADEKAASPDAD